MSRLENETAISDLSHYHMNHFGADDESLDEWEDAPTDPASRVGYGQPPLDIIDTDDEKIILRTLS